MSSASTKRLTIRLRWGRRKTFKSGSWVRCHVDQRCGILVVELEDETSAVYSPNQWRSYQSKIVVA